MLLSRTFRELPATIRPGLLNALAQDRPKRPETIVALADVLRDFGEVEQLWERRADTEFLQQVAEDLQRLKEWPNTAAPANAPLNYEAVVRMHLRAQAIWRKPPSSARVLLRRLEFILEHAIIDSSPFSSFKAPGQPNRGLPGPGTHPESDRSGYDGWLTDTGTALN